MTLTVTVTDEERRLLRQLLGNALHDLDQKRMLAIPDSPEEKGLLADQRMIEGIRGNLAESRRER